MSAPCLHGHASPCCGNGPVFLSPPVPGAQWQLGAVGNAEWTGVPLAVVQERAGLGDDVCEIILEGADRGIAAEQPRPPGPISYARSIPLSAGDGVRCAGCLADERTMLVSHFTDGMP